MDKIFFFSSIIIFIGLTTLVLGCQEDSGKKMTNSETNSNEEINLSHLYPSNAIVISTHSEWARGLYPKRIKEFKANPLENDDIVFLGNSITEYGGDWSSRFDNPKVKNRGIAGDTTDGVLARLNELIYFKPSQVFILIGINEMGSRTAQNIHDNIIRIVREIKAGSAETKIYVQTILPTTYEVHKEKIQQTNSLLQNSETTEAYSLILLYDHFALEDNTMNMDLSTDGLHLNEQGYIIWVNAVSELII